MENQNQTPSDTKLQPKVTFAKALAVIKPKVEALITETITSFELDTGDRKSRKRLFGAFVAAAAAVFVNGAGAAKPIATGSLQRRASRAINALQPAPMPHSLPDADEVNDDGDYTGDDDSDESGDDE